ncbi:FAD-dependent oxidoreductase [Desulfovibrionales bacterium]
MSEKKVSHEWFLPQDQRDALRDFFKDFAQTVSVHVFARSGHNDAYADFALKLLGDMAQLSPKIQVFIHANDDVANTTYQVTRFPTLLLDPDRVQIRFTGAPAGEEGQVLLHALAMLSTRTSHLTQASIDSLAGLKESRVIKVFVSPTCPYCPGQSINAIRAAVERPDLVQVEIVETAENQNYAEEYAVGSIPHTVYNEALTTVGLEPEEIFIQQLVSLTPVKETPPAPEAGRAQPTHYHDLVIVGSGPAGLTAGIYAKRAGLDVVVLEKGIVGGQVSITPQVENYPGFVNIGGKTLMDMMYEQAKHYVPVRTGQAVQEVKVGRHVEVLTQDQIYVAEAVLYAAGAVWKKLGVPGEARLMSKGVSFCASCDGYMFKNKTVAVIGGGNTALTDALHLHNLGVKVLLVHRRDAFRAEQHLIDAVRAAGISVRWNAAVSEIGGDTSVAWIDVRDTQTDQVERIDVQGVFLAIGVAPNVSAVEHLGLETRPGGYLKVDHQGRTSLARMYAAGDITGGVQQIVTAVSEGATAAMAVFEDLTRTRAQK